jgi:hypothetical protein
VPAHADIDGNERADQGAKEVVTAHNQQLPDTIVHRLGALPHRLPVWAFTMPPATAAPSDAAPPIRALTSVKHLRKYILPILGTFTAGPSQYRSLFQQVASQEGALIALPSAHIHSRLHKGAVSHAMRLFKFLWGHLYNGKLALRYGHAATDACVLCKGPDSCTHIGSGCPSLKGLYINRHNAAVRLIATFLENGTKGASALHQSFRLLARDAGTLEQPMSEDFDTLVADAARVLVEWAEVDTPTIIAGQDTRGTDVSLDPSALRAALDTFDDRYNSGESPAQPLPPKYLPDWLLSADASDRLRAAKCGVTPDLVFGMGVPDVFDPSAAVFDKKRCTLVLIEVGFCADLRCHIKHQEKLDKYTPLLDILRLTWGRVHLVIVPIGNAGTLLSRTQHDLASALASNPAHPLLKETKTLLEHVSAFAAQRLLSIIQSRYASAAAAHQSSQGPMPDLNPAP